MADNSDSNNNNNMSEADHNNRRKRIKEIMKDPNMNQQEKNRLVQGLMDGRSRRNSFGSTFSRSVQSTATTATGQQSQEQVQQQYVSSMARAAVAAAEFFSSDDEGDAIMSDEITRPENIYDYNQHDNRSVASSVSHTSNEDGVGPNVLRVHAAAAGGGGGGAGGAASSSDQSAMRTRSYSLQDWNEESRATAAANVSSLFADSSANPQHVSYLMEKSRPPCRHYERNCTIVAPCCGLAFGCRICHDECPVLPPPIHVRQRMSGLVADQVMQNQAQHHHNSGGGGNTANHGKQERRHSMPLENETWEHEEEETHHLIDRFAIREVICRKCYTRQSSKTNHCKSCGIQFGAYHCHICNLWMSDAESPYHCTKCGFCRVGGRENFRHCDDCGMCIDTLLFDDHNCKAGKYNSNCPVCQEDLFSSRHASHEMPCGHAIHWHCFKELTSFDSRCPICKKTAETPEQMASTWSALAMGIALQPVPPDLARVVNIMCYDCGERDYERRWHFLGVRCMHCLSFNTNVEQIILQGIEAAQYLDSQEATRGEETGGVPPTISALALAAGERAADNDDDDDDDDDEPMDEDAAPSGVDTSSGTGSTDFIPHRNRRLE